MAPGQDPVRTNNKKSRKRHARNREYAIVTWIIFLMFASLMAYVVYFNTHVAASFINSPYNTRQDTFSDRVVRGRLLSSEGEVLARTDVSDDGSEQRVYPYSNAFAHVIGYASNGKSGLESEANFQLLTSHQFFLDQLKNELTGSKNRGDDVVTSLSAVLQMTAYNALGNRRGAVIAMEPDTGRILCMVSKPDFDPNTIEYNWNYIIADENDSSLLNRATNGAYPPGSTFKLVTALDYYRQNRTLEGYTYLCEGTITRQDHSIHCYANTVHGSENFYQAFASSCNCAFADIGITLGGASLRKTAEDLLFNKSLPFESYKTSTFDLQASSPVPLVMQTAIGQGNTLVSPAHMALITCAVANGGTIMKPTLIDSVKNVDGEVVSTTKPAVAARLFSEQEAEVLKTLMKGVVDYGTASALSGRTYTAAGKTGSAEFDENGSSHSWFIGYSNLDDPDLVVSIIVENGGTGSESAVPIAAELFDAYYSR
ncbi:MAG: penicillin-binding protein 2 [Blautia sp.]|nr:penicillin-binding protein 2 [Blautia sp.]